MSKATEKGGRRTSEFAVASLTLGILTFVNLLALERSIPAIVFGVLALRRLKADGQLKGKGLAVAGVTLGGIGVVVLPALGLVFLLMFLPTLTGATGAAVKLEGHPDPAAAVAQMRKSVAAVESAEAWLQLVDAGKYAEAWDASARANQDAISKDAMVKTYEDFRPALGQVSSRKFKSATYATTLPGAASGEYVVIEFNTTFDHDAQFLERITPMLEPDGQWKVSGYYVLK